MSKKTPDGKIAWRTLPVELTLDEVDKKAQIAAKTNQELIKIETDFKFLATQHRSKAKDLRGMINKALKAISDKTELREVKAIAVKNFDNNTVEYWYSGKILETRDMTPVDRQEEMNLTPAKSKRGKNALELVGNKDQQVMDVIRDETSRKTKRTPLDRVDA